MLGTSRQHKDQDQQDGDHNHHPAEKLDLAAVVVADLARVRRGAGLASLVARAGAVLAAHATTAQAMSTDMPVMDAQATSASSTDIEALCFSML